MEIAFKNFDYRGKHYDQFSIDMPDEKAMNKNFWKRIEEHVTSPLNARIDAEK